MIDDTLFLRELQGLLNSHCCENASNTPDFILAQYLRSCLEAFNVAVQQRETWYGRDATPSKIQLPPSPPLPILAVRDVRQLLDALDDFTVEIVKSRGLLISTALAEAAEQLRAKHPELAPSPKPPQ